MVQLRPRAHLGASQILPQTHDDDSDSDSDTPPPRKKRKVRASKVNKGRRKVPGKAGKLARILELPIETVVEILSYLTPADILNLSFVDKELRARMTAPSSKRVWVAARQNVPGLPDCPVDFTEWGYARFLFWSRCEICDERAQGLIEMTLIRIRLCARCHKEKCVHLRALGLEPSEWKLIPRAVGRRACDGYYRDVVFKPTLDRLLHRLSQVKDNEVELAEFTRERSDMVTKVTQHGAKLWNWLLDTRDETNRERVAAMRRRADDVCGRLEALGYERKDMMYLIGSRHRVVRQPGQITDKLWPTVLRHVEPVVQRTRRHRLQTECLRQIDADLKTCFSAMWNSLSSPFDKYTYIPFPDFLRLPVVQTIIDKCASPDQTRYDGICVDARFSALLPVINQEIAQFRMRMRKDLCIKWACYNPDVYDFAGLRDADDALLLQHLCLATTTFDVWKAGAVHCSCSQPIHYPTLFKQPLHSETCAYGLRCADAHPAAALLSGWISWTSYCPQLASSPTSYSTMRSVVTAAGLDAKGSTIDELEALGTYHPIREDANEARSSGPASLSTTWLDEYMRLSGFTSTTSH